MLNFYNNDVEVVITIILISLFIVIIYDILKSKGKLYLNIFKMKVNIINKNNWHDDKEISDNTKHVDLDFILQILNNKNGYNSLYNLDVYKKNKLKYELTDNHNLNLTDTMKSMSGSTTYEKLKYVNTLPYEIKEYRIKIKLTKEEYENINKQPIYIVYENKRRKKKLKLNKYLNDKKK